MITNSLLVCPTNWFRSPLGSICYNLVDSSLTFQESEDACNGNGYDILMPRDPKEDMFLSWYLHKYVGSTDAVLRNVPKSMR